MDTSTLPALDLAGAYTLISGLVVLARDPDTVQIGTEPPHWMILHHAPAGSMHILRRLDGSASLGQILLSCGADPLLWNDLLSRLVEAQLLVPAHQWSFSGVVASPFLEPERDSLVHRYGIPAARRALQARQDAIVVVRGTGRTATAVAMSLAAAGVGHVHQQPDRSLRLADLPETIPGGPPRAGAGAGQLGVGSPTAQDGAVLAANLRRSAPGVRVHAPAAHHRVSLVVLAGDGPPSPSLAAELTDRQLPHLAVAAGLRTAVIGPFVLPGRSSCLICALRRRSEVDAGRSAFEEALRQELRVPPAQLVGLASALAVAETLAHLDGVAEPATLNGTIEWSVGELAPRRRTWSVHPDCGCTG